MGHRSKARDAVVRRGSSAASTLMVITAGAVTVTVVSCAASGTEQSRVSRARVNFMRWIPPTEGERKVVRGGICTSTAEATVLQTGRLTHAQPHQEPPERIELSQPRYEGGVLPLTLERQRAVGRNCTAVTWFTRPATYCRNGKEERVGIEPTRPLSSPGFESGAVAILRLALPVTQPIARIQSLRRHLSTGRYPSNVTGFVRALFALHTIIVVRRNGGRFLPRRSVSPELPLRRATPWLCLGGVSRN